MFEEYLGISTDYVVIGMAAVILLLIILMIINVVQMSKLKKRYAIFMSGKNAKSLEDTLVYRLEQVDELIENKYVFAMDGSSKLAGRFRNLDVGKSQRIDYPP